MKKKLIFISIYTIIISIGMVLLDYLIKPPYMVKSLIKVFLFLGVPLIYGIFDKDFYSFLKPFFKPTKKSFLICLLIGISISVVIILGYLLLRNWIDFSKISKSLSETSGINKDNFIFIAIYIAFVNSFVEEFFFRIFNYLFLKQNTKKIFILLFSSTMFAVYHLGMTNGWFNIGLLLLTLIGLTIGGVIFCLVDEFTNSIYSSWFIHLAINLAINGIGIYLFYFNN